MKHKINPAIDCVFKAILGNEKRKHLLIHFLNSILEYHDDPEKRITDVIIMNPYNEREFEQDKLGIVDLKAREASGRFFHAEIQISVHPDLTKRILYTWSTIYHAQMGKGDDYCLLQPLISIWIVSGVVFPDTIQMSSFLLHPGQRNRVAFKRSFCRSCSAAPEMEGREKRHYRKRPVDLPVQRRQKHGCHQSTRYFKTIQRNEGCYGSFTGIF